MISKKRFLLSLTAFFLLTLSLSTLIEQSNYFFLSDEQIVSRRVKEYEELAKNEQYQKIYNEFLHPNEKSDLTLEKYLSGPHKRLSGIEVLNVKIDHETAYVDTITDLCSTSSCTNVDRLRAYRVWQKIDNKWLLTSRLPSCIREQPYEMSPELSRALSFYFQRTQETVARKNPGEYSKQDLQDSDFANCVFIDYADLSSSDTFGQFFFDESVSSPEKLCIQIDNSYKQYDDVLISVLLAHELQHAQQFLDYLYDGSIVDCIDSEVDAFLAEWYFLGSLSEYERKLFSARYPNKESEIKNLPQPLQDAWNLTLLSKEASDACGRSDLRCYQNALEKNIREYVDDLYAEQCAINN